MPNLKFQIEAAEVERFAVAPLLNLRTRITSSVPDLLIHNILLQCQVQIEPARRQYERSEQEGLNDLFGAPARWGQTLHSMLWTNASVAVPSFQGETRTNIPLPCTFDFNVAATKYFHALKDGEVPICVLFSGTIFCAAPNESLQIAKISWNSEANFRLPVRIWQELMDQYYPNTAWLALRRDVFERLCAYKTRHGIPTWEQALEQMIDTHEAGQKVPV